MSKRKAEPASPAKSVTPNPQGKELSVMIPEARTRLTILFDVRHPEQLEAVHHWRTAFAESAELEPVIEDVVWALHIVPGIVRDMREAA